MRKNVKYDQLDNNFAEKIFSFVLSVWAKFLNKPIALSLLIKKKKIE